MPPSTDDNPAIECPPPRTATSSPCSRAKFTAATTSAVLVHSTVRAGWPGCIALNTSRPPPSVTTAPLIWTRSSSRASSVMVPSQPRVVAAIVVISCPPSSPAWTRRRGPPACPAMELSPVSSTRYVIGAAALLSPCESEVDARWTDRSSQPDGHCPRDRARVTAHTNSQVAERPGLDSELVPELRVRDGDERGRSLGDGSASHLRDPELGDDMVDGVLERRDHRPGGEGARIRDTSPPRAVDGSTTKASPCGEYMAPRAKSAWPPLPDQ